MAATCPGCGKQTSESKATCYFCGTFLRPPVKCAQCGRPVPQTRTTCQYCAAKVGAPDAATSRAVAAPVALALPPVSPSRIDDEKPAAMKLPELELTDRSAGLGGWLRHHESEIDIVLLVMALPVAVLAMLTQLVVTTLRRMRGAQS